jgi:hypothetical protein
LAGLPNGELRVHHRQVDRPTRPGKVCPIGFICLHIYAGGLGPFAAVDLSYFLHLALVLRRFDSSLGYILVMLDIVHAQCLVKVIASALL